jgi:nucleotidyltransferase/DNA polymerase involved in DNA repair
MDTLEDETEVRKAPLSLAKLRNVGRATLADFRLLGIATVDELAAQDPDALYLQLCKVTGQRHDPCAHDVFAATIHEAKTGQPLDWWAVTAARKARQHDGTFPDANLAALCFG